MTYTLGISLDIYNVDMTSFVIYTDVGMSMRYFNVFGDKRNYEDRYDFGDTRKIDRPAMISSLETLGTFDNREDLDKYLNDTKQVQSDIDKLKILDELEK